MAFFDATAGATLSLLDLFRRLVTLLALCSLLRTSEIIASNFQDSIMRTDFGLSFSLGRPRETQDSCLLHRISVAVWQQNVSICQVKCCKSFLEHTAALRDVSNSPFLLLSSNLPHGSVTVATIGRWIKKQLKVAGIDTSQFSQSVLRMPQPTIPSNSQLCSGFFFVHVTGLCFASYTQFVERISQNYVII